MEITNTVMDILGKERVEEIRKKMFGNKPEFSRADVLAFGKEVIEEAARDILTITPDISMTDLGKKLGVTESRARSIVRKMTERQEA